MDDSNLSFDWKPYNSTTEDYLEIKASPRARNFYKYQRTTFWNRYFKDLLNKLDNERGNTTPTPPPGCQSGTVLHGPMTSSLVGMVILLNVVSLDYLF